MQHTDPRIDAYITQAADFARPILRHIRNLVHVACPDVQETMKWNCPHFERKGVLLGMAAFKQHCVMNFWKGKLIMGKLPEEDFAMGQFGRITSLAGLPEDKILTGYVKKAVELNESGIKNPARAKPKKDLVTPDYFLAAIKKNKKALATFQKFSPSCKREYVEWITEAKREETRAKRLKTAIKWMAQGKPHNWKYK
jgi:uncharacterized protein YdeI (YjbR/CyaY-like superfamily)